MDKIIEISHLSKSYGDIKAVNDLSFSVYRGELFAFLGVNGAGNRVRWMTNKPDRIWRSLCCRQGTC